MTVRFEPGGTELPIVVDHKTGLMWQRDPASKRMNWHDALSYAEQLSQLFHGDWRLPTIQELQSIVDYAKYRPAIDLKAFSLDPDSFTSYKGALPSMNYFWSSTSYAGPLDPSRAWFVDFNNGFVAHLDKTEAYCVRCVRGELRRGARP